MMKKIGVLREGKVPVDRRTPVTPEQAIRIREQNPDVDIVVQKSDIRIFEDSEYTKLGVQVADEVNDCDILLGVKEVPIPDLIPDKTYLFFSHTIKKQPYNRELLRKILEKNIRLIDYECLTDEDGRRIIAFGRYAGIVGAYNGIWTYGERYNLFHLRRAHECYDLEDLFHELQKVRLPNIKIALTGGGRVSKGAMEVLYRLNIRKVTPDSFLNDRFDEPVFTQLNARDYNLRKDGQPFDRSHFYRAPEQYETNFLRFAREADLLIAGAFWDPKAPVLFHREDVLREDFNIRIISDITCDIEGSIPSTKKASTIDDPIYDYDPSGDSLAPALSDEANITVMAVDNLPCELSRDASRDFGEQLLKNVLPYLIREDSKDIIQRATICENGKLTPTYQYLQDYVDGKE